MEASVSECQGVFEEGRIGEVSNYDDLTLGDLTGPLKNTVYKSEFEQERIN